MNEIVKQFLEEHHDDNYFYSLFYDNIVNMTEEELKLFDEVFSNFKMKDEPHVLNFA